MKKVRWIIQDKNFADDDRQKIIDACEKRGIPHQEVTVIPFSEEPLGFPIDNKHENIYYGGTSMMNRVYTEYDKPAGLFYNDKTFSMEVYVKQWGKHMLSSEAEFMTFSEFISREYPIDQQFFIRPDADSKAFDGQVLEFGNIEKWYAGLLKDDIVGLGPDTKIMVGPPYNIEKEWRNYVVNGKVVTSSLYRKNFKLSKSADDIPQEMIDFVEARCAEFYLHHAFAMDIAKCGGEHEYYIIECGCINSVGFYHCDIDKYVGSITDMVQNKLLTEGAW